MQNEMQNEMQNATHTMPGGQLCRRFCRGAV